MKVFVATFEHDYGSDTRVFLTPQGAQKWKDEIGEEWWSEEFSGEDKPYTDIGDTYFDRIDDEFFNVEECEVEP